MAAAEYQGREHEFPGGLNVERPGEGPSGGEGLAGPRVTSGAAWKLLSAQAEHSKVKVSCTGSAALPPVLVYSFTRPVSVSVTLTVKSTFVVAAKKTQ